MSIVGLAGAADELTCTCTCMLRCLIRLKLWSAVRTFWHLSLEYFHVGFVAGNYARVLSGPHEDLLGKVPCTGIVYLRMPSTCTNENF